MMSSKNVCVVASGLQEDVQREFATKLVTNLGITKGITNVDVCVLGLKDEKALADFGDQLELEHATVQVHSEEKLQACLQDQQLVLVLIGGSSGEKNEGDKRSIQKVVEHCATICPNAIVCLKGKVYEETSTSPVPRLIEVSTDEEVIRLRQTWLIQEWLKIVGKVFHPDPEDEGDLVQKLSKILRKKGPFVHVKQIPQTHSAALSEESGWVVPEQTDAGSDKAETESTAPESVSSEAAPLPSKETNVHVETFGEEAMDMEAMKMEAPN